MTGAMLLPIPHGFVSDPVSLSLAMFTKSSNWAGLPY